MIIKRMSPTSYLCDNRLYVLQPDPKLDEWEVRLAGGKLLGANFPNFKQAVDFVMDSTTSLDASAQRAGFASNAERNHQAHTVPAFGCAYCAGKPQHDAEVREPLHTAMASARYFWAECKCGWIEESRKTRAEAEKDRDDHLIAISRTL